MLLENQRCLLLSTRECPGTGMEWRPSFSWLILLCCLIPYRVAAVGSGAEEDEFLRLKYGEMDKGLKKLVGESLKYAFRVFYEATESVNISENCVNSLLKLATGLRGMKQSAIRFVDASGKLTDGLLNGNTHMLGSFDQCLLSTYLKKTGEVEFRGQYCLIMYKPYLPNPELTPGVKDLMQKVAIAAHNVSEILRFYILKSQAMNYFKDYYGLCTPSSCTTQDVRAVTKYLSEKLSLNLTLQYCQKEADIPKMDGYKIFVIFIFSTLGLLAILGTVIVYYCELKNYKPQNNILKALTCFSISTNFPKLMDSSTPNPALSCLAGIRVLTLFYIILGHHYVTNQIMFSRTNGFAYMASYIPEFFTQIVLNGYLSVDIFFLMGGFLHSYNRISEEKKGNTIPSAPFIIVHRLWRLYPAYIFSILMFWLLTPRGPLSFIFYNDYLDLCKTEWWKNLLFINNFFDSAKSCFPHTWYLACDIQMFLISLFTIPLMKSHPRIGVAINVGIIVVCLACTTAWIWIKNIPPTFLSVQISLDTMKATARAYMSPIAHASTYFMGVLLGYFVASKEKLQIHKLLHFVGWPLAALSFTSMLFITQRWNSGIEYSSAESAIYFALSKPLYAGGVAWLIFCCVKGQGGVINYILSLKMWFPLSRISFMLFLVSFPLQLFFCANKRTTVDMHPMILIWQYFGDLCVSCLLSLALVILTESPLHALEKLVFVRRKKEAETPNHVNVTDGRNNEAFENQTKCDIDSSMNSINTIHLNIKNIT